ncbi:MULTISPECIES: hypothetical protein [Xenorhabdus]|uniref:Uncharacterized protein n=2 Tax=Xenorhabdus TaxID=626 RepID=A0A2G0Q0B1_XENHO|nr:MULTISPECIES: hypothetical protein [Xenorhabdus]AOM42689.1 hypothetical protein A9255_20375 [Xenorhabdus hominickii]PHM52139.1 hypothetical protein Xhom_04516 [Xenorhabdus hominickii]PHM52659.1 hypothetical protein Xhom_04327 [Xenorhabdus hominickii]QTL40651.1 hypothetical protein HGO23_04525 [Xenorhabdus budapestensis]
MKYSYRITKYTNINENGDIYSDPDEWTSFFDIGQKVKKDEYERIENQYIDYIINLCNCLGIKSLKIQALEVSVDEISYIEGESIDINQLKNGIKSILREDMWCKLISDTCEFHFGYDFYMYFVSKIDPKECIDKINTLLTVQKYRSPYLD